jgi:acid phosphatase type 7
MTRALLRLPFRAVSVLAPTRVRVAIAVVFGIAAVAFPSSAAADPVVVAGGDIACSPTDPAYNYGHGTGGKCRQSATADLAASLSPGWLLPLGDEQYYCGLLSEFNAAYGPTWGRMDAVARPVLGNHEYGKDAIDVSCHTSHAEGYFDYFGSRAGPIGKGYYSYDVGAWHVIALNSECWTVACGVGSPQETWLRGDLAANPRSCTLAYFHRPLVSSLTGTESPAVVAFWRDLYNAHAELILNGHAHNYERFAPQNPSRQATSSGIREFVVGTGGRSHHGFNTIRPNSQRRNSTAFGVLKLVLHPTSYSWNFIPIPGQTFTDSGTTACHD